MWLLAGMRGGTAFAALRKAGCPCFGWLLEMELHELARMRAYWVFKERNDDEDYAIQHDRVTGFSGCC